MESKNVLLGCILIQVIFGFARCDIAKDRERCANELVGLATCLPYVSGEGEAPPSNCCSGFKQVLKDSCECICILIKDRDDPSLGLKINATLALSLPAKCNASVNESITDCPTILHLPPNSPDAKVFEDFAKDAKKTDTATPPAPGKKKNKSDEDKKKKKSDGGKKKKKSDGGKKKIWFEAQIVAGLLIAMAQVHFFTNI